MYTSTLLAFALAVTLAAATPIPLDIEFGLIPPISDVVAHTTLLQAKDDANGQIRNMQTTLADPTNVINEGRITAAFGPDAVSDPHKLAAIRETVNRLDTEKLHIWSANPQVYDTAAGRPALAKVDLIKDGNGDFQGMGWAHFGSRFHSTQFTDKQRAGILIHEATHQQSQTRDDMLESQPPGGPLTYKLLHPGARPLGGIIPPGDKIYHNAGYARPDGHPVNVESDLGTMYENVKYSVPNMHQNADSYMVFGALCSRSLYKRALSQEDPVGYFLARRQQCTLPPDYYAKKAAAKAAAAKSAAGPSKSPTTKEANSKAATAKATKSKGLTTQKAGKGGKASTRAKAVKGARKVTKGTGTKAVRNSLTKAAKGVRGAKATKGPKSLKGVKGIKATKGLKAAKGGKGAKVAKGAKSLKGVKAIKATKGLKAVKGVKGLKVTKATKGVKATKASKVVKDAKSLKGPKGVKATKAVKAVKSVKAAKGAKPSRFTFGKFTAQTSGKSTASSVLSKLSPNVSPQRSVTSTKPAAQVAVASTKKKGGKMARRDLESVLEELD